MRVSAYSMIQFGARWPRLVRNRVILCLQRSVAVFVGLRSPGAYSLGCAAAAPTMSPKIIPCISRDLSYFVSCRRDGSSARYRLAGR